jgi:hypothetical protein
LPREYFFLNQTLDFLLELSEIAQIRGIILSKLSNVDRRRFFTIFAYQPSSISKVNRTTTNTGRKTGVEGAQISKRDPDRSSFFFKKIVQYSL